MYNSGLIMIKLLLSSAVVLLISSCSVSKYAAFTRCEFRLHSLQDLEVCNVKASEKESWSDFSYMQGQVVVDRLLKESFPFELTVNIEARNPGRKVAAVKSIQWIALIDDIQVAQGEVDHYIKITSDGGTGVIPLRLQVDLFDYLKGDDPQSKLNFALNLIKEGKQDSKLSLKIRPSIRISGQEIRYSDYFRLSKEFSTGD
jgi:hypothetical protein